LLISACSVILALWYNIDIMENTLKTKYSIIGGIVIVLLIILLSVGRSGTAGNQSTSTDSTNVPATTSVSSQNTSSGSSLAKVSGQTYYNNLLGFSFDNPHPGTWVIDTSHKDGSLVSFGPKVPQIGIGLKVTYQIYADEFPTYGKITTIDDLKAAVIEKYRQVIPNNINIIRAGGFSMVEVKGLASAFSTTNAYFVFLSTGALNFGGTGNLSSLIHKI